MIDPGSAVGSQAEHLVLLLLYQLAAIFATTRVVVWISKRFLGQTDAAGEILAGLALGPSLLGALFPGTMQALFAPATAPAFTCIAQIGLILLMFQIGLEFRFRDTLRTSKRTVLAVSIAGIAMPFALGFAVAPWFLDALPPPHPDATAFRLFFAVAMSITAIPILGRIFIELGLSHTRIAAVTIGAAAIDDIAGWLILGAVAAVIALKFDALQFSVRLVLLAFYIAIVMSIVRPALLGWIERRMGKESGLSIATIASLLIVLFVSAAVTSNLGVFAIIGGFAIGIALHENRRFVEAWNERVGGFVQALFLPVFFAYTGLRTDIGVLTDRTALLQCLLIIVVAFAGKFGGAYLAARATGETHRDALTIGVAMNTRALMELIVLNIGFDLGVLPRPIFTMLVLMAIASTFLATPLIRWLMLGRRRTRPAQTGAVVHTA